MQPEFSAAKSALHKAHGLTDETAAAKKTSTNKNNNNYNNSNKNNYDYYHNMIYAFIISNITIIIIEEAKMNW